ncbi:VOC family protein [Thalassiella azotivora]
MSDLTENLVISLPVADRRRAADFYRAVLGLEPEGPPADDGLPEPLSLRLREGVSLMLVPTDGFGWVLPGRRVADAGVSECVLGLSVSTQEQVRDVVGRAAAAGGQVVAEAAQQPWGYSGVVADPDGHAWMVHCA